MTKQLGVRSHGRRKGDQPKPIYASRTIICAFIAIIASVALFANCAYDNERITAIAGLISVLSSFGALIFRLIATRPIE